MLQNTTTVEVRDSAAETRESPSCGGAPVCGWDWPDEARLTAFAEQAARAEKDDQGEQANQSAKDDAAYAALYFVS